MRKYLSNGIRTIAFLMILLSILYCINQVLMPKYILKNSTWPTTSSYNQFYEMEENSIDVLFLGSSVAVNAFSPQEIYNDYGIRSYNLGSEQQSIFLSYFWLKEALRFQSPEVVVLDTKFLFELHPESIINTTEGLTRKCLDPMKWSSVKREAVSDLCKLDSSQSEISYYLKNIRFHTRWTGLKEYDVVTDEVRYSQLKGYAPIETYGRATYNTFTSAGDTETKQNTQSVMQTYLDKMVALCKEQGITLVLVALPGNSMNDAYNNTLTAYAEENGLDYYNMCETQLYASIGAELPRENMVGHENLWGAIKMSQFVGGLLADIYHVSVVKDEQYEITKEYYEHIKKNCELPHITNINEYLEAIGDENYTVFIAAKDDATARLTEDTKQKLRNLGLKYDLTDKYRWSYAAVISPENGIAECLEDGKTATLAGSIRDKNTFYSISSCGYKAGSKSSITIDGTEYCRNTRGLNIVVYDNKLMKVIDKVTFDTWGDSSAKR